MVIAKQGIHPPSGYFFKEMDGTTIKGRGWLEVERKVIRYRSLNRFPKGEPMREILEQAQLRWPAGFWVKRIRGE